MEEKKEENNIRGPISMTIIVTVIIVVVGAVMFTSVMNPLCNDAVDKAEDKLAELGNKSIDYQQGYNDALDYVRYYMNEPTNVTSSGFDPCDYAICNIEPILVLTIICAVVLGIILWFNPKNPEKR